MTLNSHQFQSVKRLGRMVAGDYDPMRVRELTSAVVGKPHGATASGERLRSMSHLQADMTGHGMSHPVILAYGHQHGAQDRKVPYLSEGHHRMVAARNLGMEGVSVDTSEWRMPAHEITSRLAEFAGGYTRPGERTSTGRVAGR
jgi:hypothetical protein